MFELKMNKISIIFWLLVFDFLLGLLFGKIVMEWCFYPRGANYKATCYGPGSRHGNSTCRDFLPETPCYGVFFAVFFCRSPATSKNSGKKGTFCRWRQLFCRRFGRLFGLLLILIRHFGLIKLFFDWFSWFCCWYLVQVNQNLYLYNKLYIGSSI